MAQRTTEAAVRAVINVDSDVRLAPYIRPATALTDWLVSADSEGMLTQALLLEIETHLAAHFYQAHRDRMLSQKSTGQASGSYQGSTAMVLMSTDPGQTACILDVTGRLAERSKDAENGIAGTPTIAWIGTDADSPRPDRDWMSY